MATSASRSRLFPNRSRKAYRLEMEGRTLYLLLSLMVLTGGVIFYLGLVTGKALRDPNAAVPLSAELRAPGGAQEGPGTLSFQESLTRTDDSVETLLQRQQQTATTTDQLLDRAQKELELREVQEPKAPTTAAAPAKPQAAAPQPSAPRATGASAQDAGLYTVQVFSSQRQSRARDLMAKLRNQGFSAYLNRYEAADKRVWYRVRVGKTDRSGAEALSDRLRNEAKLKNPQIQKL